MKTRYMIALCTMAALFANAASLTGNAAIAQRLGDRIGMYAESNQVIYIGALVAVDSYGNLVNAADSAASNQVIGINEAWIDQTGSNYVSNKLARVRTGIYRLANGSSFTKANIGQFAYVYDNATVKTSGGTTYGIVAGVIEDVDAQGVWVNIGPYNRALSGNLTALNVSGAAAIVGGATVGGTFDATGASSFGNTLLITGATTAGALTTRGTTTLGGATVTVTNDCTVAGALTATGLLRANGGFNTDGGTFSVADTTGNTIVGGTLNITGIATATTNLIVSGNETVAGTLGVTGTATAGGYLCGTNIGVTGIYTNSPTTTNVFHLVGGIIATVDHTP